MKDMVHLLKRLKQSLQLIVSRAHGGKDELDYPDAKLGLRGTARNQWRCSSFPFG